MRTQTHTHTLMNCHEAKAVQQLDNFLQERVSCWPVVQIMYSESNQTVICNYDNFHVIVSVGSGHEYFIWCDAISCTNGCLDEHLFAFEDGCSE